MKRKQIYITEKLDHKLSEVAMSRGVPQAEIIREGLELYLQTIENEEEVWDEFLNQMESSPYKKINWNRDDLYKEGVERGPNSK